MFHCLKSFNLLLLPRISRSIRLNVVQFQYRQNMHTTLKGELIDTFLNLERLDANLFRSSHLMPGSPRSTVVYGGQVIGQSLVAANSTVPDYVQPHSLHCYFIRTGDIHKPMLYYVDRLRDGNSFFTRSVKAVQEGETMFSCMISFHKDEPDSIAHQDSFPNVPMPDELLSANDVIRQELEKNYLTIDMRKRLQHRLDGTDTFDMKPVKPEIYLRTAPHGSMEHVYCWVKAKDIIGDDSRLHHCVAAYISDFSLVSTAMAPHARSLEIGMAFSLDHTIWFHRSDFKIDDWMLYDTWSPKAAGSRAFSLGRLWTRDGKLAISTAQESLIRAKLPTR